MLVGVLMLALGQAPAATLVDRVAATVDGYPITRREVLKRARPYLVDAKSDEERAEIVKVATAQLVDETLLAREAARLDIQVSEADIDGALESVKENAHVDDEQLQAALTQQHLTMAEYREALRGQLLQLRWLLRRADRRGAPSDEAERGAWLEKERARLLTELREAAVVEVRS